MQLSQEDLNTIHKNIDQKYNTEKEIALEIFNSNESKFFNCSVRKFVALSMSQSLTNGNIKFICGFHFEYDISYFDLIIFILL